MDNEKEVDKNSQPMTVWQWMGTLILLAIPIVNVVCCILWFFGVGNRSRRAFIRAFVMFAIIIIVLVVILVSTMSAQIVALLNSIINSIGG